jgi:5-methylcytosine-specific restriction endonuclease McrA
MPSAIQRPCANAPICKTLVDSGLCDRCRAGQQQAVDGLRDRPSSAVRGYDAAWHKFRQAVFRAIHRISVQTNAPGVCCGARPKEAPETTDSLCRQQGRITARRLHLDHIVPLTDAERANPRAVCDWSRVQVLCESCHTAKTNRDRARGLC